MLDRDYRDIVTGLALAGFGGAAALYSLANYSLGSVSRMGPGMVPTALGAALVVFGIVIAIPALSRRGSGVHVRFRVVLVLAASIISFSLMIDSVGLVPSVFVTTVIATFAERNVKLLGAVVLAATLSLITWAIFIAGLRLPLASFDWPF
ncbi:MULTISPECIES: tripartite tricarboxylate transporter TctB family protein [Roseinatronobacter]|uniref:Tripartite tricarboxylate transporter TctB family protein n=1 Tax=Roseinatronobacter domitianus TaxID=2940293 RepID=A0ABT0M5L0_9RHOB|nr:tripartite tricarboxylate transporter TctB family protein [Roseibaca sp.]MCL1629938.1 tripartite tricarboxylate transporter TctB family protein [Roseibaca domitiana]